MKTRYFITALLLSLFISLSARVVEQGDMLYVDVNQSHESLNWSADNAHIYMYIWRSWTTGDAWVELDRIMGNIYGAEIPAGLWDRCVIIRKEKAEASWNNVWNQSCNIVIAENKSLNMISKFWSTGANCSNDVNWSSFSVPSYNSLKSQLAGYGVPADEISICPDALGGPFSLHPRKLNTIGADYDYVNVKNFSWLMSTDGLNWKVVKGEVGHIDISDNLLPTSANTVYYYMHCDNASYRRLIKLTTDAPECGLTCAITSFETAISAVNADDNTYTLDGMVAFGKASGNLVIECDGKSISISNPKSPQSFSLHGVPASTVNGQTTTATAYFTGDQANCSKTITIPVPNSKQAYEVIPKHVLTGETATLEPKDADPDNDYVWIVDGVEYHKADGQAQNFTTDTYDHDTHMTYVYKEYYPITGNTDDLMDNGSYELSPDNYDYGQLGNKSTISDYNFWGYYPETSNNQVSFYTNESINPCVEYLDGNCQHRKYEENGFAVVRNANNFFNTYAKVHPRDADAGLNFALFDAATGSAGANKRAWYTNTSKSPNLKLKQGTTYVFSFWAANVNNYGEMDNAAKLQFRIKYNGKTKDLGDVLDLNSDEYRNNIWHQRSATFYADEDADNVEISVVNLNNNIFKIGNDFALDDIQFHAISSVSRVVKSHQVFEVYFHEPKIKEFTAEPVQMNCDVQEFKVNLHVEFDYPKGNLVIVDANNPSVVYVDKAVNGLNAKDTAITINELKEGDYKLRAYFAEWRAANKEATFSAPVVPHIKLVSSNNNSGALLDCNALTYTINGNVEYINMNGNASVWVDDNIGMKSYEIEANQAVVKKVGYEVSGIPADGKRHTLHVEFAGRGITCPYVVDFYAPFSPVIDKVEVKDVVPMVTCSTQEYQVTVEVTTHYDATGRNIVLTYADQPTTVTVMPTKTVPATGKKTTVVLTLHNPGAGKQKIYAALEHSPNCTSFGEYDAPQVNSIAEGFVVRPSETDCGVMDYSVSGRVEFDMADGDLVVEYDNDHRQTIAVASGVTSADFRLEHMNAQGDNLTLTAYFTGSPDCKVSSAAFSSPAMPQLLVTPKQISVDCNAQSYQQTFEIRYSNLSGSLIFWADTQRRQTISLVGSEGVVEGSVMIPADGKVHTVNATGDHGCQVLNQEFTAIHSPVITGTPQLEGVPESLPCTATQYDATLIVNVVNYAGTALVVSNDAGPLTNPIVVTAEEMRIPVTLTEIGKGEVNLRVQFDGYDCTSKLVGYNTPVYSSIAGGFAVQTSETDCGVMDYSVSGRVEFNTVDGDLVVEYDNGHRQTIAVASGATSADFRLEHMNAEGKNLTLTAYFTGSPDCKATSSTFDSPVKPSIAVEADDEVDAGCDNATYQQSFTITYVYQRGTMELWVDNGRHENVSYTSSDARKLTASVSVDIPADGKPHTVSVRAGNGCEVLNQVFIAKQSPQITQAPAIEGVPQYVNCSTESYDATLVVYSKNYEGKSIVVSDEAGMLTAAPVLVTSEVMSIPLNLSHINEGNVNLYVKFDGYACNHVIGYTSPTRIAITPEFSVTRSDTDCGVMDYSVSGTVEFNKVDGDLVVEYDVDHSQTISLADGATSADFRIEHMNAEGDLLSLTAYFTGNPDCKVQSAKFNSPVKPYIKPRLWPTSVKCDNPVYEQPFDIDFVYQRGAMEYWLDADEANKHQIDYIERNPEADTKRISVSVPADGGKHTLHITAGNGCSVDFDFEALLSPVIVGEPVVTKLPEYMNCGQKSYGMEFEVKSLNSKGLKFVVEYNDGLSDKEESFDVAGETTPISLTLRNPNTVGNVVKVHFEGYDCVHSFKYDAPLNSSLIAGYQVTVGPTDCGVLDYSVSGTVEFDMAVGNIVVQYDADHRDVIPLSELAGKTSAEFQIDHIKAEGDNLTLRAWFTVDGYQVMCDAQSAPFASPAVPTLSATMTVDTAFVCEDKTYTVSVNVDAKNQSGTMVVRDHNLTAGGYTDHASAEFTLIRPTMREEHKIEVIYDGEHDCSYTIPEHFFTSPAVPSIGSLSVSPLPMACGDDNYAVSLVLTFENQDGNLMIEDNGVTLYSGQATQLPLPLVTDKIILPTGAQHDITVTTDKCQKIFSAAYTEPVKPDCRMFDATICQGENYIANGFVVNNPAVGEHKYALAVVNPAGVTPENRLDSLALTVKPQPAVKFAGGAVYCNTDAQFSLPYSVAAGAPDMFSIRIDGSEASVEAADGAININNNMFAAGEHTVEVTVGEEGLNCTTTEQFKITVADGMLMYRKWEDVLFIDNFEERFTAYQWYHDGQPMAGETLQRLYDPNGLNGLYYCQMTTTDGLTIVTCEQDFGQVQKSAEVAPTLHRLDVSPTHVRVNMPINISLTGDNADDAALDVNVYDATGKHIASYSLLGNVATLQAPSQSGMFIIKVKTEFTTLTKKIIVY